MVKCKGRGQSACGHHRSQSIRSFASELFSAALLVLAGRRGRWPPAGCGWPLECTAVAACAVGCVGRPGGDHIDTPAGPPIRAWNSNCRMCSRRALSLGSAANASYSGRRPTSSGAIETRRRKVGFCCSVGQDWPVLGVCIACSLGLVIFRSNLAVLGRSQVCGDALRKVP